MPRSVAGGTICPQLKFYEWLKPLGFRGAVFLGHEAFTSILLSSLHDEGLRHDMRDILRLVSRVQCGFASYFRLLFKGLSRDLFQNLRLSVQSRSSIATPSTCALIPTVSGALKRVWENFHSSSQCRHGTHASDSLRDLKSHECRGSSGKNDEKSCHRCKVLKEFILAGV